MYLLHLDTTQCYEKGRYISDKYAELGLLLFSHQLDRVYVEPVSLEVGFFLC